MSKPVVIILHPKDWALGKYEGRYEYHHVSIGGKIPRKGNGVPTFDGYADKPVPDGIRALENAFRQYQPDLFLFWLHGQFGTSIVSRLKKLSPRTKMVMWFGNHRNKTSGHVTNMKRLLSMVFLNSKDPRQIKMYQEAGLKVGTLWDGFAPDEIKLQETKPKYDCVFGGNTYMPLLGTKRRGKVVKLDFPGGKIRYDFISRIGEEFNLFVRSGYRTWPKHVKVKSEVFHPIYTSFLRSGKITLNLNHFPTLYQAYTRRTIRSIFAKRCHVTLYIPGMEEHFTNHKHLVWFKNVEEGVDLVRYYLEHDNEREEIAEAGYNLACEKFTFECRLRDFERMTNKILPNPIKRKKK